MLCACGSGKYVEKGKHGGLSDMKVLKKKFTRSGEIQCQDFYHITEWLYLLSILLVELFLSKLTISLFIQEAIQNILGIHIYLFWSFCEKLLWSNQW